MVKKTIIATAAVAVTMLGTTGVAFASTPANGQAAKADSNNGDNNGGNTPDPNARFGALLGGASPAGVGKGSATQSLGSGF